MKYIQLFILSLFIILTICISCDNNHTEPNLSSEYLRGTWIDKDSYAIQFIDFYSENKGRFGIYSKDYEEYTEFEYRIIDSKQIAMKFIQEDNAKETFHNFLQKGNDTIIISDLTCIPENPNTIYLRKQIITEKQNDTIIIGCNQIFFDFDNDLRLELGSVIKDSIDSFKVCLDLILKGNYYHNIRFKAYDNKVTDTLIDNFNINLIKLIPTNNQNSTNKDYIVKLMINKQN